MTNAVFACFHTSDPNIYIYIYIHNSTLFLLTMSSARNTALTAVGGRRGAVRRRRYSLCVTYSLDGRPSHNARAQFASQCSRCHPSAGRNVVRATLSDCRVADHSLQFARGAAAVKVAVKCQRDGHLSHHTRVVVRETAGRYRALHHDRCDAHS